jgi:hypothetical protein
MIEYYIDGSAKDHIIGAGIVKVNEFGFIVKHHFSIEHISPSSMIAEGYSLEKVLDMIQRTDIHKNELINIYTDCQNLYHSFMYNENGKFNRANFFAKQEGNVYVQHLRDIYLELISRSSSHPMYHCDKTKQARPLIKLYFKDEAGDKKYLKEAHTLSRAYIKEEEAKYIKLELKAIRKNNKWYIVKDNKDIVAENKRPLIALSEALVQTDANIKQIQLCESLETLLKSTNKNRLSKNMKSAVKIIEDHKLLINL